MFLGAGDTLASIVGKKLGRVRLQSRSPKTIEGTVAGVLGMVIMWWGLHVGGLVQLGGRWGSVVLATCAASLLEASTSQVDNLYVPLVYFALLAV